MPGHKSVFISYSSRDLVEVNIVVKALEDAGISYWKAPDMIPAGSNYAREIPKAICDCDVFLVLISQSSQESIWVEKEIDCAVNYRKTVVPLRISDCDLNQMFKFYLNNVQTINYLGNKNMSLKKLVDRLSGLLNIKSNNQEVTAKINVTHTTDVHNPNLDIQTSALKEEVKDTVIESIGTSDEGTHNLSKNAFGNRKPIKGIKRVSGAVTFGGKSKASVFALNPQPTRCEYCAGDLEKISHGLYVCKLCGRENLDFYNRVRNYLNENGPQPMAVIVRQTGVPRESVEYFIKEEMLEIPTASNIRLSCERCGAAIRSGRLCDDCKASGLHKRY